MRRPSGEAKRQLVLVARCVHPISAIGLLALSIWLRFPFGIMCSVSALLFCAVWLYLDFMRERGETEQKAKCRWVGCLLIPPSLGMAAAGLSLFVWNEAPSLSACSIAITTAAGLLAASLVAHLIVNIRDASPAGRFLRRTTLACFATPASVIIVILLHGSDPESVPVLGCLTAAVFGAACLAAASNMIMVSRCGYKGTRESIRMTRAWVNEKRKYLPHFMAAKDILLVLGKSLLSLVSLSFFMLANALYSVGMGIGRRLAYRMPAQSREDQVRTYRRIGIIISVSSICYVLYAIRLFFGEPTASYHMVVALVIAAYTFIEFGVNIREAIRLRKSHALEARALRALSFASTLLCFVLTQTAIMSFADGGDNRAANALSGIIFGGLATLVGVYVIVSSIRYTKKAEQVAAGE